MSQEKVTTNYKDLENIFSLSERYKVPFFQRNYRWRKPDQWEPLWEDVKHLAESSMSEGRSSKTHFLGAMVFAQRGNEQGEPISRDVIDGQQRLITLQIMVAACRDIAKNKNYDIQVKRLEDLIQIQRHLLSTDEDGLRVYPTKSDRNAFKSVMRSSILVEYKDSLISKAYRYFKRQIEEWLKSSDNDELQKLDLLIKILRQRIKIVTINLTADEDAQLIFESLNARSQPLLASDLIKNHLFHRAEVLDIEVETLYDKYWSMFDKPEWSGRKKGYVYRSNKLDEFLYNYLKMSKKSYFTMRSLFVEFRDFLEKYLNINEQNNYSIIESILVELEKYAVLYNKLHNEQDYHNLFFDKISNLSATTTYPLILYILGLEPELPEDTKIKLFHFIEDYLVRRKITGLTTQNYNRMFPMILRLLSETKGDLILSFHNILSELEGDSQFWPQNTDFRSALLYPVYKKDKKGNYTKKYPILSILVSIENYMRKEIRREDRLLSVNDFDNLSVEHLLPQSWKTSPSWQTSDHDKRDNTVHLLGNLTLVTRDFNSSLSNKSWSDKLLEIKKHSILELNRSLPNTWDENMIAQRSEELAEIALKIWSGPIEK